jgi:hypothetical protein
MMQFRSGLASAILLVLTAGTLPATLAVRLEAAAESRQQAESLARKIALITQRGATATNGARTAAGPSRTEVSQDELNSWFAFRGRPYLPAGVSEPNVTMIGDGTMRGAATVDLETVGKRHSKSGGVLDLWSYLGGKVPVAVTGTLRAREGRGQFEMKSAEIAGIPVPKALLQELVSAYASTPDQPKGISLDDSFELPARIRSIDVGRGQLVVVQ